MSKLIAKLTGAPAPSIAEGSASIEVEQDLVVQELPSGPPPQASPAEPSQAVGNAAISVSVIGPSGPVHVAIPEAKIDEGVSRYSFVLRNDLPELQTAEQWWNEEAQKRRMRGGSDNAYAWLTPFVPLELLKHPELIEIQAKWGLSTASLTVKTLRAQIRAKRKNKEPHTDLLQALYGAAVAADFVRALEFEYLPPHYMARFVAATEVQAVAFSFSTLGYQSISTLGKTDVKWLVEAFGEPAEHQCLDAAYPHLRQNAISRYCWQELRSSQKSLLDPQQAMQTWLTELVRRNLSYHHEQVQRMAAHDAQLAKDEETLAKAWAALDGPVIVADLETTGLDASENEIIEIAAIQVDASGRISGEYSVFVRPERPVPPEIASLTGISQQMLDKQGKPLEAALAGFLAFAGSMPVFFHNAPFDDGFLHNAAAQCKVKWTNPVYDTLSMSRQAWPGLRSYRLAVLAEKVEATAPTHRALDDAKATLAVLLAAKKEMHTLAS
ncbi:3'-5' exonuclease [Ralstonia pseudosolanacearum]|uniref:3'-5' exonuclease n=1 Tax=Ralstonia pseudosolanacearum TaxID=1310165 RepID=UPI0026765B2A|nr:3'-5' exonuclease [Ralstonia pseudosolanacearum]